MPKCYWSLGTTKIRQRDGYCVCAIDDQGDIAHEALTVTEEAPPGRVLTADAGDWAVTGFDDAANFLAVARRHAEPWTLQYDPDAEQWSAPAIFDGLLTWFDRTRPMRPACTALSVARMGQRRTRILQLDFALTLHLDASGEHHYRPTRAEDDGTWSIKYNGWKDPPDLLPPDSLLAAFVSFHKHETEYAYLKIGSILWRPPGGW